MENSNLKHIGLEELKVLYKDIVELAPNEYIVVETDADTLEHKQSLYVKADIDIKEKESFIISKANNFLMVRHSLVGYNVRKFTVNESFILNKDIYITLAKEILLSFIKHEECRYALLVIITGDNKKILLRYDRHVTLKYIQLDMANLRKDMLMGNGSDIGKNLEEFEAILKEKVRVNICMEIGKDIENALRTYYQDGKVKTLISATNDKVEDYDIREDGASPTEIYYIKTGNFLQPIVIRSKTMKEFEEANPEESNLLINVKKVIRLTKEEFDLLTDEDKLIYNNIEKYLQVYTTKGIKFDSVMATIRYLEQVTKKVKSKKVSKLSKGLRTALNTFKLHYVVIDENYERKTQCEYERCGHYRHYKNGNVIYIDKYKAGKGK